MTECNHTFLTHRLREVSWPAIGSLSYKWILLSILRSSFRPSFNSK